MIGIIIAMDKEIAPYIDNRDYNKKIIGGKEFYTFKIGNEEFVAVKSGVGKVNAAYATTLLITNFAPKSVISTGISGGLGKSKLLDMVAATSTVQYDVDTTALGDELGFVSTVNKIYFEADKELTDKFVKKASAKKGVFACGDKFVADEKLCEFIRNKFDAVACDMESGAIAQIAYITKTPYAAIRCISDGADNGAPLSFAEMTDVASQKLFSAIVECFE